MTNFNNNYFSRNRTECLKGLLAICVLIHHTYQKTHIDGEIEVLVFFLQSLGYYCVSIFFFISGYGLYCSLLRNKNHRLYLCDYQYNRALPIFVVNAMFVIIYSMQKLLLGFDVGTINFLKSFVYGGDIVDNGWFLLVIILFYEFFYFSAKLNQSKVCEYVLLFTIAYMLLTFCCHMTPWWYITALGFPAGCFYANYKKNIDSVISRKHKTISVFMLMSFLSIFLLSEQIETEKTFLNTLVSNKGCYSLLFHMLTPLHSILFVGLVVMYMVKGPIENRLFIWLSSIYLEIYVLQGFVFNLLRNKIWYLDNNYQFALCSFVVTVFIAYLVHPYIQMIISKAKSLKYINEK